MLPPSGLLIDELSLFPKMGDCGAVVAVVDECPSNACPRDSCAHQTTLRRDAREPTDWPQPRHASVKALDMGETLSGKLLDGGL